MRLRYLIIFGYRGIVGHQPAEFDRSLKAAGMSCQLETGQVKVFISSDTPNVRIPGGLLIGRIFDKDGRPITSDINPGPLATQLFDYLLQSVWGEYLAIQVDCKDGSSLTLLRDPSGAVPCVYAGDGSTGFVTSDISLAVELGLHRKEVNWHAVSSGLIFPYVKTSGTALKGVSELLPGCALKLQNSGPSATCLWSPWKFVDRGIRHQDRQTAATDVHAAVAMVVGSMAAEEGGFISEISGGLDSSIVSTCLGHSTQRALFYTLTIPVAGTDERPYARLVTDALGRTLYSVQLRLEDVHFEYEVSPTSVIPAVGPLENVTNQAWQATAAQYGPINFFSGGGGDSVFCYLMTAAPAADAFLERGLKAGIAALQDLASLHQCTLWKAARLTLRKVRRGPAAARKRDTSFLNPDLPQRPPGQHPWLNIPEGALPGDHEKILGLTGTQIFRETALRGEGNTIHFPLLSQPVMEACLKTPTWMWIRAGLNRAIARDAFADRLPSGILERRSKGSYISYLATAYADSKRKISGFLMDGQLSAHDLLDRQALARFLSRDVQPRDLSFLRIFYLCMVENWVRRQMHGG